MHWLSLLFIVEFGLNKKVSCEGLLRRGNWSICWWPHSWHFWRGVFTLVSPASCCEGNTFNTSTQTNEAQTGDASTVVRLSISAIYNIIMIVSIIMRLISNIEIIINEWKIHSSNWNKAKNNNQTKTTRE